MSRTRKGSKGPGWEPWSNLLERQLEAADVSLREYRDRGALREAEQDYEMSVETDEALYCDEFGPCVKCKKRDGSWRK